MNDETHERRPPNPTADLLYDFDLAALGRRIRRRHAADHDCPHDRPHATGMEVCRACGDYGVCRQCGDEYIRTDVYYRSNELCYPCSNAARLMALAEHARAGVAQRIAERKAKEETQATGETNA